MSEPRKIGIVGWGLEAKSAFKFFGPDHEYLIVNESIQDDFPAESDKIKVQYLSQKAPAGIPGQVTNLGYLEGIDQCDKIVYQPTAYFNLQKAFGDNKAFWDKTTTAYDIFFENSPTKNIIGITGSKGKGTTSSLIYEMLKAAGLEVHLGGNIGTPILDILPNIKEGDWVVWEMANFQLKPAHHSPHIGVALMIIEEHLDWHPNFQDYLDSKANVFRFQTKDDVAIYYADNDHSKYIAGHSAGLKVPYFAAPGGRVSSDGSIVIGDNETPVINKRQLKLLGEHNLQNVCAALTAAWQVSQNVEAFKKVLSTFSGLEHRLELVRELKGVKYYDDSFSTTPDSVMVALEAIIEPVVLILGGHDKGLDYSDMVELIATKEKVRHVITIGQIGPGLAQMLRAKKFDHITEGLQTMTAVVNEARSKAQPGDAVLLSCGSSSFGMFKDYKDRGDQFKSAVQELS